MKHWIPLGVVLSLLLILALGLFSTAWNPGDFTGNWYSSDDGELYLFREGMVVCEEHNIMTASEEAMCGAYCFDRDSVAVFAMGVEGLETPRQLYLIHGSDGDRLCETKDGSGSTFFYRERASALDTER